MESTPGPSTEVAVVATLIAAFVSKYETSSGGLSQAFSMVRTSEGKSTAFLMGSKSPGLPSVVPSSPPL